MSKQKVVVSLLLFLSAAGGTYFYFSTTPKFALYEIVYAVKTKNRAKFEKRVDLEAVLNQVVDKIFEEQSGNTVGRFGAVKEMLKSRMVQGVRSRVTESFFSNGAPKAEGGPLAAISSLREGISFKGVGEETRQADQSVTRLKFLHERTQNEIVLDLKLKKQNGTWRLVEVGGLVEAFKNLRQWDQADAQRQVSEQAPAAPDPIPQAK